MMSQGKMTCFHFSKQGRKIQFFSQLFSLLFFPQFGIFDFSHIGMIYESEITKTMKGLLNSMAYRSKFFHGKKLSSSTYVGKTEISIPLLGKKSQLKNFPYTSPSKIIKNYQNFHHQKFSPSTVNNSIGMMSSKMVDSSSNSNRLTLK